MICVTMIVLFTRDVLAVTLLAGFILTQNSSTLIRWVTETPSRLAHVGHVIHGSIMDDSV